jgi:arsenate reductase
MTTVLFACVHNAGRSQMAAAFFSSLADPSRAVAVSAGTQPGEQVHPEVVEVMREIGIDLRTHTVESLAHALGIQTQAEAQTTWTRDHLECCSRPTYGR